MKNLIKLSAFSLALLPLQVHAATGNVPFNGAVTASCTITDLNPGTLCVQLPQGHDKAIGTTMASQQTVVKHRGFGL